MFLVMSWLGIGVQDNDSPDSTCEKWNPVLRAQHCWVLLTPLLSWWPDYLSEFERNEAVHESEVGTQRLFSEPKKEVHKYAAGGDLAQSKHMVAVNWVLAGAHSFRPCQQAAGTLCRLQGICWHEQPPSSTASVGRIGNLILLG